MIQMKGLKLVLLVWRIILYYDSDEGVEAITLSMDDYIIL